MEPLFAAQRSLLPALLFITAVVATPQGESCDCESTCAQIVAQQREEIARLKAEVRTLRGVMDGVPRRAAAAGCPVADWTVRSDADVGAFRVQGCRVVRRLTISGEVTSLAGLFTLEAAQDVSISRCSNLESLDGLEKLVNVTSTLTIVANPRLWSVRGVQSLEVAGGIHVNTMAKVQSFTGLEKLRHVGRLYIHSNPDLQSLSGLDGLAYAGSVTVRTNPRLESLTGLSRLARVEGLLHIVHNTGLRSLAGLEGLESAGDVVIESNYGLLSLTGLEGLVQVGSLDLLYLRALQSVAALRSLTRAWAGGIRVSNCQGLQSLNGLGALRFVTQLRVAESPLTYLGGPFARGASARVVRIDERSWPRCTTPHEREALLAVAEDKTHSFAPEATWGSGCGADFGTFSCTKGHPCTFSLANHKGKVVFVSGRFTGCGACLENHLRGNVTEGGTQGGTVDLGYALWDEEAGLHSICLCGGGVRPVAQLLLRGPRQSAVQVCIQGRNCSFRVEGEGLERTDRVVLMSNCSGGNPRSAFAASWTADKTYLLHHPATWYATPPDRYQVCWRAPCTSIPDSPTCPAPEDSYFHVGEVELFGAYSRNYEAVLGDGFSFSVPNIGFGVSDGDHMRLRRGCGQADEEGTDLLAAISSDMVFDFGRLTEDRVQAGSYRLCWCQEREGAECDAEWHFWADAGVVQIRCPAGQELVDSQRCEVCPAGKQQPEPGLDSCLECPTGQFSRGGSDVCEACPGGEVAGLTGSSACVACLGWQSAGVDAASCSPEPAVLVLLALFCLFVAAEVVRGVRRRLLVADVSLVHGRTIVTTLKSHGLANFGRPSFPVTLHGTGHPGLDSPVLPFRARVKDATHLELLTWAGESISQHRLDTSMGTLVVAFPRDLLHQRWIVVPWALGLPVLLVVVAALYALVLRASLAREAFLGAAAAALACTAASVTVQRWPRATPLKRRLSEFQLKLAQQPSSGRRCEKAPNRAVAIGKLHELLHFFQDFIRDRSVYYLDTNILQPLTKAKDISYAELVGPEQVEWFVSHFWGNPFEHFCVSLRKHAQMACGQRDWARLRYWVCFCSNNQHHIADELQGGLAQSSFHSALTSGHCRGACMVLDEEALPLTRIWCLFELLKAVKLGHNQAGFQGLFLCSSTGVLNTGGGGPEVAMALVEKAAQMNLQTARATHESDAVMIRTQVVTEIGSYDAMNHLICHEMRNTLARAQENAHQHFDAVLARLDETIENAPDTRHDPAIERVPNNENALVPL